MPAILIELGFLSNADEEDFLQGAKGQDFMASAIYRAFKDYKGTIEGKDVMEHITPRDPQDANAPDGDRIETILIEKGN